MKKTEAEGFKRIIQENFPESKDIRLITRNKSASHSEEHYELSETGERRSRERQTLEDNRINS